MSKMMKLLATAMTAIAFAALPAVASAGEPQTHCESGAASCPFTVAGGAWTLSTTSGLAIEGTGVTGTGSMGTTTGTLQLTFTGVTEEVFHSKCNSPGQPAGTVVMSPLTYHNTYVKEDNKTTPGILITGSTAGGTPEHFAELTCLGVKQTMTGKGLIGDLESPKCGETSNKGVFDFATTGAGQQLYKKVTNTGTEYDLTYNGTTMAIKLTMTFTLINAETTTLTCV